MRTWPVPEGAPESSQFRVTVDGQAAGVYGSKAIDFTHFTLGDSAVEVRVSVEVDSIKSAVVRPLSAGIEPRVEGKTVSFSIAKPAKLSVEINDRTYLLVFADPPETEVPSADDASVIFYGPGYHDLGDRPLRLQSGQTLYISGGAYLTNSGTLLIQDAEHVKVRGRGVFAGCTRINASRHVDIEGVIIHPLKRMWMNRIDASQDITYRNVKAICGLDTVPNFDGFDVMSGCHRILFDDVFVRGTDDCLTIKHHPASHGYWRSKAPVSHVTMQHSTLWNLRAGTIFRIGPETIGPSIERITMRDIDVIHASRGFEILPVDGVRIRDVLLEDIRIEQYDSDLIAFDMRDWYRVGPRKGHAEGIYLRNWEVHDRLKGWKVKGADAQHTFTGVCVDDVRFAGKQLGADGKRLAAAVIGSGARLEPDADPPEILAAAALAAGDQTVLYLVFSEPVSEASAVALAHYSLGEGVDVKEAQWDFHFRQVILRTSRLASDQAYTIAVNGVCDLEGNALSATVPVTHMPRSAASDAYADFQGKFGWFYEQYNPKPTQTYNNRKDILPPPQYWLANYYLPPDGDLWLGHDADTSITSDDMSAGEAFYAVRTWMAPVDGRVVISGTAQATPDAKSRVRISHNAGASRSASQDRELWQASTFPAEHPLTFEIKRGDVLRFILESGKVRWNPAVSYAAE